jgi:hypothetical protein
VNWLTAMRLFLDHEETELERRFGKQSPEVAAFTAATAKAFDAGEPGYRFAFKFRNYVQQCGVPLSSLDFVRVPGSNPRAKQSVLLRVDRDELLANFDGWGPVKKDLWAFPPRFELLPLIASAMNGIRDVHKACAEIDLDQALAQSVMLARVLDRIESAGSERATRCLPQSPCQRNPQGDFAEAHPIGWHSNSAVGRAGRYESRQSVVNARRLLAAAV